MGDPVALSQNEIGALLDKLLPDAIDFLCEMIKYPSTRGNEGEVNRFIYEKMRELSDYAQLVPIPESFVTHPAYSWPLEGSSYSENYNVRLRINPGSTRKGSLIINAHTDVVPASKNQADAFVPRVVNGTVYGRGACDDKGQIAVIYLVLKALAKLHLRPLSAITVDIVIEEENGGNGTLFAIQDAPKADAAIVMEPSELKIMPAVRGAVWFEITLTGRPGHSGRAAESVSALKLAIQAMEIIEDYHDELLKRSRGINQLFDQYEDPMPVTFGVLNSGDWPATIPALASLKGVFGFLPNMHVAEVQEGIMEALKKRGDPWLREHFEVKFNMLNNDGSEISADHPLVESLIDSASWAGIEPSISALTAACDAWRYNNTLGIPTVVMGAGSLKHAHSNIEQISIDDIRQMAKVLIKFISNWSGLEPTR